MRDTDGTTVKLEHTHTHTHKYTHTHTQGDSVLFWEALASQFGDNELVWYELYNEPHHSSYETWLNGTERKRRSPQSRPHPRSPHRLRCMCHRLCRWRRLRGSSSLQPLRRRHRRSRRRRCSRRRSQTKVPCRRRRQSPGRRPRKRTACVCRRPERGPCMRTPRRTCSPCPVEGRIALRRTRHRSANCERSGARSVAPTATLKSAAASAMQASVGAIAALR